MNFKDKIDFINDAGKLIGDKLEISDMTKEQIEDIYDELQKILSNAKEGDLSKENTIFSIEYISRSGTKYKVGDNGYIYRNGKLLSFSNGGVYKYAGIVDREKFLKLFDERTVYGTILLNLTIPEAMYYIFDKYYSITELGFNDIGDFNGIENKAIVGLDEYNKTALLTTSLI